LSSLQWTTIVVHDNVLPLCTAQKLYLIMLIDIEQFPDIYSSIPMFCK